MLGIPIKADQFTKEKAMFRYSRLLIDMALDGQLPKYIDFINDCDVVIRKVVKYEWTSFKCDHYRIYGHKEEQCRKKVAQTK